MIQSTETFFFVCLLFCQTSISFHSSLHFLSVQQTCFCSFFSFEKNIGRSCAEGGNRAMYLIMTRIIFHYSKKEEERN